MRDARFKEIDDENTFWAVGTLKQNIKLILLFAGLMYVTAIHVVAVSLLIERVW